MKRLLLIISILLSVLSATAQTTVDIGNLRYAFNGAYATVTRFLGGEEPCIVPPTIEYNGLSYTVTIIGNYAFGSHVFNTSYSINATKVTEVSLPETITRIEDEAFYRCDYLTKVTLSNGLTSIGDYAFADCTNLARINLPNSLIYLGNRVFNYCQNLTEIIIPENVSTMSVSSDYSTFYGCSILRTIIYKGQQPPSGWTATSFTYVPDKQKYSSPRFSINDAQVIEMITFHETEFGYTGQSFTPTWTNNVEGWSATPNFPTLDMSVGSHEILVPFTFVKGSDSFTANVMYRYKVTANQLTVSVNNATREYGEENPQFTLSYSGFTGSDNPSMFTTMPTVSTSATRTSNVGQYALTVSGGVIPNYYVTYVPGTLTITKAPLSAKVADTTRVYGANNPTFKIDYQGLKNGETQPSWSTQPTIQTEATKTSPVGQYAITATNGVPVNYQLGNITPGTLTIKPATLSIKANNATRQYYSENPELSYTCTGFVNSENASVLTTAPQLSTTALLDSPVGQYKIEAKDATSPNYTISYVDGTMTVTQRTLQACVGNYSRLYNEDNPAFEVNYNGFVGNDDENVLTAKPFATTTATNTSNVGNYTITVSGGSATNYKFSYSNGTLTINKAEQTITWEQDLMGLSVNNQVELMAQASSGLPVTYAIEGDNGIAELYTIGNKTYLDCKAEGTIQITAIQNGNQNYYSTPKIRKTVKISGVSSAVPVTGVTLNKQSATLTRIGETLALVATVQPANASNKDVTWSSTNEDVCIVQNGNVIAVGEGSCVIIVTTVEGNFIATCAVKVTDGGSGSGSGVTGDVTGDGLVDISDVNAVINLMLGKQ